MSDFFKTVIITIIIIGTVVYLVDQFPQFMKGDFSLFKDIFNPVPVSVKNAETGSQVSDNQEAQIPSGFTKEQLSPYFEKGKIVADVANSEISLTFNFDKSVNVTGWTVRTNSGQTTLPLIVNDYDVVNSANISNFAVPKTGLVKIYSNSSATGRNFRLNKCVGFLNSIYTFNPKLPEENCPEINRGVYAGLSGICQTYILTLEKCKLPDVGFMNSLPGDQSGIDCRNFLNKINYYSCANSHKTDSDFYQNEWWIWNNKNILDSDHDWIRLFDNKGLLVDSYIY